VHTKLLAIASSLFLVAGFAIPAQAQPGPTAQESIVDLYNPCAVFRSETSESSISRIRYGEAIEMTIKYTTTPLNDSNDSDSLDLRLTGKGRGFESNLRYDIRADASVSLQNLDEGGGEADFIVRTKLRSLGESSSTDLQSQDAGLNFKLHLRLTADSTPDQPIVSIRASSFDFSCNSDNWKDLTKSNSSNNSVGKGFGDPWNKYAWSMKDFNQQLYVGTKNAHYNYQSLQTPTEAVVNCQNRLAASIPSIYLGLACLELYDSALDNPVAGAKSGDASIWAHNFDSKSWTQNQGTGTSQGFRVMETHNGNLYAGSDLGSFIMGVQLGSQIVDNNVDKWMFPGSRIVVNNGDGNWTAVDCQPTDPTIHDKPCTSSADPISSSVVRDINISFRALASHESDLYLGTFNFSGAELWKYDSTQVGNPWTRIAKFDGTNGLPFSSTISELKSFDGKLFIGLGFGPSLSSSYLFTFDEGDSLTVVPNLPPANGGSSVFKLFVSSSGELYVGLVDFNDGFNLHALKPNRPTQWRTITETGFSNSSNVYAWSMAELNGRIFLGTFNSDMLNPEILPRGSAELWASDNGGVNWKQLPTPLSFSPLNYGFRTMEVSHGKLYLGTASNMLAPDVISEIPNLPNLFGIGAGAQVWEFGSPRVQATPVGTIVPETPVPETPIPQTPVLNLQSVSKSSATVSWPSSTLVSEYEILLDGIKVGTSSPNELSFDFKNLKENREYLVNVIALSGTVRSQAADFKFRTNSRKLLSVSFNSVTGKMAANSTSQIRALMRTFSGFKNVKITVAAKPISKSKGNVSRAVAKKRLEKIVFAMSPNGKLKGANFQISPQKLVGQNFNKTLTVEMEIQFQ
jgi:hypothetical protein